DLAHNAVRLYETRDCEGVSLAYWATEPAGEVPIEPGSSIRLTVSINGKPVRAQLDSGAGYSILSKPDAARLGVTPESSGAVAGLQRRATPRSAPEARREVAGRRTTG